MARGAARNTPENVKYLESCEAVTSMRETGEVIHFFYDASKQPTTDIPEGVFFDLTTAPF